MSGLFSEICESDGVRTMRNTVAKRLRSKKRKKISVNISKGFEGLSGWAYHPTKGFKKASQKRLDAAFALVAQRDYWVALGIKKMAERRKQAAREKARKRAEYERAKRDYQRGSGL